MINHTFFYNMNEHNFIHRRYLQTTIWKDGNTVWTTPQGNSVHPFTFSSSFLVTSLDWSTYRSDSILTRRCDVGRINTACGSKSNGVGALRTGESVGRKALKME